MHIGSRSIAEVKVRILHDRLEPIHKRQLRVGLVLTMTRSWKVLVALAVAAVAVYLALPLPFELSNIEPWAAAPALRRVELEANKLLTVSAEDLLFARDGKLYTGGADGRYFARYTP